MKINVYSCGCTAIDVSIISECDVHGGHVLSAYDRVKRSDQKAFQTDDGSAILFYTNLSEGMRKLSDKSVGLVLTYPDHYHFNVRALLHPKAWAFYVDPFFTFCSRVLKDDGKIFILIEPNVLHCVLFSAFQSGFDLSFLKLLPVSDGFKFALVFSNGPALSTNIVDVKSFEKAALDAFSSGLILDTSCLHSKFIQHSRTKAKTVGIVTKECKYSKLKKILKQN